MLQQLLVSAVPATGMGRAATAAAHTAAPGCSAAAAACYPAWPLLLLLPLQADVLLYNDVLPLVLLLSNHHIATNESCIPGWCIAAVAGAGAGTAAAVVAGAAAHRDPGLQDCIDANQCFVVDGAALENSPVTHRHKAADAGGFAEGVHVAHKHAILQICVVTNADGMIVTCGSAATQQMQHSNTSTAMMHVSAQLHACL